MSGHLRESCGTPEIRGSFSEMITRNRDRISSNIRSGVADGEVFGEIEKVLTDIESVRRSRLSPQGPGG
jgi:hypothetical protein